MQRERVSHPTDCRGGPWRGQCPACRSPQDCDTGERVGSDVANDPDDIPVVVAVTTSARTLETLLFAFIRHNMHVR